MVDKSEIKPFADLSGANLCEADLYGANLRGANLSGANLRGANLREANMYWVSLREADLREANMYWVSLREAYLRWANLRGANLREANLRGADLREADLCRANLCEADLYGADLCGANLHKAKLPHFQIPQSGTLEVWKKTFGKLVLLEIPSGAKRTASLVGRKCRAEFAKVLWIEGDAESVKSTRGSLTYKVGDIVYPDKYDDDIRIECTHGIHFFLTLEEAREWQTKARSNLLRT